MKKRYKWAKRRKDWTKELWRKVVSSDESHFFVQGQRSQHVRKSSEEKIGESHINQFIKGQQKKTLWGCSLVATGCFGGLSPPKNMKQYILCEFLSNLNVKPPPART